MKEEAIELLYMVRFMAKFRHKLGTQLKKKSGSEWEGKIVGFYSTDLTAEGYNIESKDHKGSVQIYPVSALEAVK
jgi:dihydrofolate reductase (trimethoprim resistance protein)